MIDRFVRLVRALKIWSQIEEKKLTKKTTYGQELAWGRNADFQCFPNKSVSVLEAKSFHCRLHHVTKKYDFCKSERKIGCAWITNVHILQPISP